MRIAWLSHTPLSGKPFRTARVVGKALEKDGGWFRSVVVSPSAYGSRTYPTDATTDSEGTKILEEADLVVLPAYLNAEQFADKKPVAWHLTTEPFRWVDKDPSPENSTIAAQYQWRFADHLTPLPDCIPVSEPMWAPAEKPTDKIVIAYTPTSLSEKPDDWGRKGYRDTVKALKRVERAYPDKVRIFLLVDRPYEEVMAVRRRAHIVIDECVTGSYHSTTLEGLSCGAATICRIDDKTQEAINALYGEETILPVLNYTQIDLEMAIKTLVANPDLLEGVCQRSREWMLKNYSEEWQAEKWVSWHRDFLKRSVPA